MSNTHVAEEPMNQSSTQWSPYLKGSESCGSSFFKTGLCGSWGWALDHVPMSKGKRRVWFALVFNLEELPDHGWVRILLIRDLTQHGVNGLGWTLATSHVYQLAWEAAECLSSKAHCFWAIYINLKHLLLPDVFSPWSLWGVKHLSYLRIILMLLLTSSQDE